MEAYRGGRPATAISTYGSACQAAAVRFHPRDSSLPWWYVQTIQLLSFLSACYAPAQGALSDDAVWHLLRTSGRRAASVAGRLDGAYWLIGPGLASLAQGCRCALLLQAWAGAYRGGRPPTACYGYRSSSGSCNNSLISFVQLQNGDNFWTRSGEDDWRCRFRNQYQRIVRRSKDQSHISRTFPIWTC